jgi:holin (3TMs family)
MNPITTIVSIGEKLIERFIPDPKAKAEALQKLAEMQQSGDLQVIANQVELDKLDAASTDKFQSRWRPFIGWVCGSALAIQLAVGPLIVWGTTLAGHPVPLPIMQTELLTTLLVGMLGLGGMRTVEKLNGASK